jgi:hypothetical protein
MQEKHRGVSRAQPLTESSLQGVHGAAQHETGLSAQAREQLGAGVPVGMVHSSGILGPGSVCWWMVILLHLLRT